MRIDIETKTIHFTDRAEYVKMRERIYAAQQAGTDTLEAALGKDLSDIVRPYGHGAFKVARPPRIPPRTKKPEEQTDAKPE